MKNRSCTVCGLMVSHWDYEPLHMASEPGVYEAAETADADHQAVPDRPFFDPLEDN